MNALTLKNVSIFLIWLVHISAMIGISLGYTEWFVSKTPFNLLLIFLLVAINFPLNRFRWWGIFLLCFATGYAAEWLGVHRGLIFGEYTYGANLGVKLDEIPVMIAINWAVLVLVTGSIASRLFAGFWARVAGGAGLMLLLDLFMEPVAPVFDFWEFSGGQAPLQNYAGWFVVAALLHIPYQKLGFEGDDKFSLHVYGAQLIFFVYFFLQYGL